MKENQSFIYTLNRLSSLHHDIHLQISKLGGNTLLSAIQDKLNQVLKQKE